MIAIITHRASETRFYEMLAKNQHTPLKQFYKKIPKKMLYKYLNQLQLIQQTEGIDLFKKSSSICPITGQPVLTINRSCIMKIKDLENNKALVRFSPNHPFKLP